MPLISDPEQVREIYREAARRQICLASFCTANPRMTEAIFRAVHMFGEACGLPSLPVVIAVTANHPAAPQLRQYTGTHSAKLGLRALLADVRTLLSEDSPYRQVRVMLHLDHGQPGVDEELVPLAAEEFASIMWDCSQLPIEENVSQVTRFVQRYGDRLMVEGAVCELAGMESPGQRSSLTDPMTAERYMEKTGVTLIVPDLGTLRNSATAVPHYDGPCARSISSRIGPRLVLHGSSHLRDEDLACLPADGIIRTNVWWSVEQVGAQAVARDILSNLGNLFAREQIEAWQSGGFLGPRFSTDQYIADSSQGRLGPKDWALQEHHRREVWINAVVARMLFYLEQFGYSRWTQ